MSDARTITETDEGLSVRSRLAPASLTYGASKAVTTAATAEVLGTSKVCRSIYIRAKSTNTNNVYVGTSNVSSTLALKSLGAGDSVEFSVGNVDELYLDVDTNGEGVDYWLTS